MKQLSLICGVALLFGSVAAHADALVVKSGDTLVSIKTVNRDAEGKEIGPLTAEDCQAQLADTQSKLPAGLGLTAFCAPDNQVHTGAQLK